MRLIVGLGNPGIAVRVDAAQPGLPGAWTRSPSAPGFAWSGRRRSRWSDWASSRGQEVALAKPQTMMNLSGLAVRDLLERLECGPEDLIVLYDDVALPWGMLRIRERGTRRRRTTA